VEYIVKKGDTLSVIASKYGVNNLYHILVANNLTNAAKLRIGQKLLLPNPTKDPNPKKPQIVPTTKVATKTPSTPPAKAPAKKVTSAPKTLTYGTYSLDLKVDK
jgi:LysM repeat protein